MNRKTRKGWVSETACIDHLIDFDLNLSDLGIALDMKHFDGNRHTGFIMVPFVDSAISPSTQP